MLSEKMALKRSGLKMKKTKNCALMLVFLMVLACLPIVGASAEDTDTHYVFTLYSSDAAYVRSATPDKPLGGANFVLDSTPSDNRMAFVKFDLEDYDIAIKYADEISFNAITMSGTKGNSMSYYALPDELDSWDGSTLTYNGAKAIALSDDATNLTNYAENVIGEFNSIADKTSYATSDIKDTVKNDANNIFGIKLASNGPDGGYLIYGNDAANSGRAPSLTIKVRKDLNNSEFDLYYDLMGFSAGDFTNVKSDIVLPTEFNDINISWKSSRPDIISDTGKVTRPTPNSGAENVELTATFSRNGASLTRTYNASVVPLSTTFTASADTYGHGAASRLDKNSGSDPGVVLATDAANYHRFAVMRFDITDSLALLDNIARVELKLATSKDAADCSFDIHPISVDLKNKWEETSATYRTLTAAGLKDYFSDKPISINNTTANTSYTVDVTDYALGQKDGILEFKLESTNGVFTIHSREATAEANRPTIIIYLKNKGDFKITINGTDSNDVLTLPEGDVNVKAVINNSNGAYNNGLTLVCALYDTTTGTRALTSVKFNELSEIPQTENAEISLDFNVSNSANQEMAIFIWDSLNNIRPFFDAVSLMR